MLPTPLQHYTFSFFILPSNIIMDKSLRSRCITPIIIIIYTTNLLKYINYYIH